MRLCAGMGTVFVQTISATSGCRPSRSSAAPENSPCVQAIRIDADAPLAEAFQQLQHGGAGGDLVVQDDHVAPLHLADHRADETPCRR